MINSTIVSLTIAIFAAIIAGIINGINIYNIQTQLNSLEQRDFCFSIDKKDKLND